MKKVFTNVTPAGSVTRQSGDFIALETVCRVTGHVAITSALLLRYPIVSPRENCAGNLPHLPGVRSYGLRPANNQYDVFCYIERLQGGLTVPNHKRSKQGQKWKLSSIASARSGILHQRLRQLLLRRGCAALSQTQHHTGHYCTDLRRLEPRSGQVPARMADGPQCPLPDHHAQAPLWRRAGRSPYHLRLPQPDRVPR